MEGLLCNRSDTASASYDTSTQPQRNTASVKLTFCLFTAVALFQPGKLHCNYWITSSVIACSIFHPIQSTVCSIWPWSGGPVCQELLCAAAQEDTSYKSSWMNFSETWDLGSSWHVKHSFLTRGTWGYFCSCQGIHEKIITYLNDRNCYCIHILGVWKLCVCVWVCWNR